MASSLATIQVRIEIKLDGEPVSRMLEIPATAEMRDGKGLTVHLHLNARTIATKSGTL
jgi:hypothetical protein